MKKKIFGLIAVLAIAAVAAWNVSVNFSSQKNELSDISMANVEALAQENGGNCPGRYCSYTGAFGSCSACCPRGKHAICNDFGCGCS
jgi:Tfp pilus assembly protein FimT